MEVEGAVEEQSPAQARDLAEPPKEVPGDDAIGAAALGTAGKFSRTRAAKKASVSSACTRTKFSFQCHESNTYSLERIA